MDYEKGYVFDLMEQGGPKEECMDRDERDHLSGRDHR